MFDKRYMQLHLHNNSNILSLVNKASVWVLNDRLGKL